MRTTAALFATFISVGLILGSNASFAETNKATPPSDRVRALLEERRETLKKLVALVDRQYQNGTVSADKLIRARVDLLNAELELAVSQEERIAIHVRRVEQLESLEKVIQAQWQAANAAQSEVLQAKAARLEAQVALQRAREQMQ